MTDFTEHTLNKDYKFRGRILNLRVDRVRMPDGREALREVVEHPGGVGVLAVTDDDEVLLVRQFRYPYAESIWEIPAGKAEPGEDPRDCGIRELREETGAEAGDFRLLSRMYPTPAYCDEIIHIFLARKLRLGELRLDDGEFLDCRAFPLAKALEMVETGEIRDAKTQIALLRYAWDRTKTGKDD